jgi:hypothetical protein
MLGITTATRSKTMELSNKEKQNRLMKRLDKIDAEYEAKIDKIKAEWKKQNNIVIEQVMQLRGKNNEK